MADPVQGRKCEGMVLIPDSRFMMGSEGILRPGDEKPRHEVRVTGFYIDKHEVTNGVYALFASLKYELRERDCKSGRLLSIVARGDDVAKLADILKLKAEGQAEVCQEIGPVEKREVPEDFDGPNQPAINVNWFEADAFCRYRRKRLPTEAEWEKAAIGPTKGYDSEIIHGTKSGRLSVAEAVYNTDRTADVCSKLANGYGLYDMAGNAWEWVNDWYGPYYANSPDTNPQGSAETGHRVLRGGGFWGSDQGGLRAAYRGSVTPDDRNNVIGFRCASSQDPLK